MEDTEEKGVYEVYQIRDEFRVAHRPEMKIKDGRVYRKEKVGTEYQYVPYQKSYKIQHVEEFYESEIEALKRAYAKQTKLLTQIKQTELKCLEHSLTLVQRWAELERKADAKKEQEVSENQG